MDSLRARGQGVQSCWARTFTRFTGPGEEDALEKLRRSHAEQARALEALSFVERRPRVVRSA